MNFWLIFALRSCLRRRKRTVITLVGIGFGIAMLIVLGAIMVGVNDTMVENAISLRAGHLVVVSDPVAANQAAGYATRWTELGKRTPGVVNAVPRLVFPAVLQGEDAVVACSVRMVSPSAEPLHSPIPRSVVSGRWLTKAGDTMIGTRAAKELHIQVGDSVTLMTATGDITRTVTGIFSTGVEALDKGLVLLPIAAGETMHTSRVTAQAALFTRAGEDLNTLRNQLAEQIGAEGRVRTWRQQLPDVAQLVKLNEFAMQVMIILVVAILGFGIANALLISVMDRYRQYAVLKALGAGPLQIMTTVVGEAAVMSLAAGITGSILGVLIVWIWRPIGLDIGRYTSFNPHFSVNTIIHPRLTLHMVVMPEALALAVGIVAAFWPAFVAGFRTVVSGMRDL